MPENTCPACGEPAPHGPSECPLGIHPVPQPRRPVEPAVVGPSGVYGFREVEPCSWETGRVVQIVERTNGVSWIPTPARYYAKDIVRWGDRARLAIDSGQGWYLPDEDVVPWVAFARSVAEVCPTCDTAPGWHDGVFTCTCGEVFHPAG